MGWGESRSRTTAYIDGRCALHTAVLSGMPKRCVREAGHKVDASIGQMHLWVEAHNRLDGPPLVCWWDNDGLKVYGEVKLIQFDPSKDCQCRSYHERTGEHAPGCPMSKDNPRGAYRFVEKTWKESGEK